MRGAGSAAGGVAKIEPIPDGAEVAAGCVWGLRLSGPAKAGPMASKVVTRVGNAIRCICTLCTGDKHITATTHTKRPRMRHS